MKFEHVSVLKEESIKALNIKADGIYLDGTLGAAGHSLEICKLLSDKGRLIAFDQDINAINKAKIVLKDYDDKLTYIHDNFVNIKKVLAGNFIEGLDGILLDIGVSSHQFDEKDRGFSYRQDARLDMRMDREQSFSAFELVNEYSEDDLSRIIFEYGEDRWAKRIAEFIVRERKLNQIKSTFDLIEVINKAIPKGARRKGAHPAKKTFQAIRIEVNQELEVLEKALIDMVDLLNPWGRIAVITFHSLEDRIVKRTFRDFVDPCTCPSDFPICVCNKKAKLKLVNRKAIVASQDELEVNRRSRSAKLRVAEKLRD